MAAYARVAVARSGAGFTVTLEAVALAAVADFPAASTGSTVATHFGLGRASSGTGELLFFGALTPNITITNGVIPRLDTGTTITEAESDGAGDTAANNLLKLLFANTTWANIGDATGLPGSAVAGSFYLSLHTASPAESGSQTTNEVSYT